MDQPKCLNCGQPIYLSRPWKKYCDYDCQQEFHRKQYHKVREWYRQEQEAKQRILNGRPMFCEEINQEAAE